MPIVYATITYVCHTCGERIIDVEGKPDIENVIFIDTEGNVVDEPPFPPDTTSHHPSHLEE